MSVSWGTVPQWLTAFIAITAGVIAIYSVYSQREIARKRAAVDVFIKTEMDEKMIDAYDKFISGLDVMRNTPDIMKFCTDTTLRQHYLAIRKYLNVHELIAVGIKKEVLDDDVCFYYWRDTLTNGYREAKPVLDYLRTRPRNRYTYIDLRLLNDRWLKKMKTL